MSTISKYLLLFFSAILQVSFFNRISVYGYVPNFFLILLVVLIFTESPSQFEAPYFAFFAGAVWDLLFAAKFGVCTVLFFLLALALKRLREAFEPGFWFYLVFGLVFFVSYFALEPLMLGYNFQNLFQANNFARLGTNFAVNFFCTLGAFIIMDYGFGFIRNKTTF